MTDTPEPLPLTRRLAALPEPTEHALACEACGAAVGFLRVVTPEGLPDFLHLLDDYAWLGWSWSESDHMLTLVGTCSRACLGEWWRKRRATPFDESSP